MRVLAEFQDTVRTSGGEWSARSEPRSTGTETELVRRVARNFRVSKSALFATGRSSARESLARHTAMYLMHVVLGRSYTEVGSRFRRHRTSVCHACARIEDRRDDRTFDARISRLEQALAGPEKDR